MVIAAGRGGPGIATAGGILGSSPRPAGNGCRGPERIWPGLGDGIGFAGIAVPRVTCAAGGCAGCAGAAWGAAGAACGTAGEGCAAGEGRGAAGEGCGTAGACGTGIDGAECEASGGRSGCTGRDAAGVGSAATSLFASGTGSGRTVSVRAAGCTRTGSEASTCATSGACVSASSRSTCDEPFPPVSRRRSSRTTWSSSELECVFLSGTPSSGNKSRMTLGLTSSSRASSLMRILLIRSRPCAALAPAWLRCASPPSGNHSCSRMLRVFYRNRSFFQR